MWKGICEIKRNKDLFDIINIIFCNCFQTTQVPQYILEECIENGRGSMANILVTQPRRISALSVATRVAEERGECIGEKSRQVIFENSGKNNQK